MQREFSVIIKRDEDGFYVATVPQLRGCHTQAKSLAAATERIREAVDSAWRSRGEKRESWWRHEPTPGIVRRAGDCRPAPGRLRGRSRSR